MHTNPSESRREAWQNGFIELGFEHPFLLHGLLALSAVHKASFLQPTERECLHFQADSHITQALDTYRKHLELPTAETAIPMFILSTILLTYNFGSVQEQPDDPISELHHSFMLLKGIMFVIIPHWETVKNSHLFAAMTDSTSPDAFAPLDVLSENDNSQEISRLSELTDRLLDSQDKDACANAINELHITWLRFRRITPDLDEYSLLFNWPARLTDRFFDLLAAHNPVACIITTHFAAMLAQGRPVWYSMKWPRWLLAASEQLLAPTPDLVKWLDWPQQVIHRTEER